MRSVGWIVGIMLLCEDLELVNQWKNFQDLILGELANQAEASIDCRFRQRNSVDHQT